MNYFRCGGGRSTHTATKITVAKTPLATFESNVSGLYIPEIIAYIQATQSGTGDPSPSNPRPINGVSEVTTACNAINQWDEEWEIGGIRSTDGTTTVDSNRVRSKNLIPIKSMTGYYFKAPASVTLYFYDANGAYLSYTGIGSNISYTIPSGVSFIKFVMGSSGSPVTNIETGDFSINYPATDTAYHAYTGTTATTALGGTYYLCTLNVGTGLLTVLGKYFVFNSAEYYGTYGYDDAPLFYVDITGEGIARMENTTYDIFLISNMLSKISTAATRSMENYEIRTDASNTPTKLYFRMDDYTSKADIDAFLANNPLQVVAELATPQTYQLTPAQIEQLLGQNNVFCSTDDVAVKYWKID